MLPNPFADCKESMNVNFFLKETFQKVVFHLLVWTCMPYIVGHDPVVARKAFKTHPSTESLWKEEPGLSPAEPAFVESSITPQPTPASTRMYSMPVESVTGTERILWTDDTTSPFKPAEQTAWLTSCLHSQPLTFTLHRLLTPQASESTLCWAIA